LGKLFVAHCNTVTPMSQACIPRMRPAPLAVKSESAPRASCLKCLSRLWSDAGIRNTGRRLAA